jgi:uncharacterized membrane protein (DUF485 family)
MSNMRLSARTWAVTASILAIYFAYILTIGFAPELLGHPIAEGMLTSWGLVLGAAIMIVCIVAALIYTGLKNRSDAAGSDAANSDTASRP